MRLLFILAALGLTTGCYYDNLEELHPEVLINSGNCDTSGVMSYSTHIAPILKSNCGSNNSCHNGPGVSSTSAVKRWWRGWRACRNKAPTGS